MDEISILWVITAGYALFLPSIYLPQSFRVQRCDLLRGFSIKRKPSFFFRHRFVYSCALFALVITCFSFVYPYANAFALMILGLPSIGFIVRHLLRYKEKYLFSSKINIRVFFFFFG